MEEPSSSTPSNDKTKLVTLLIENPGKGKNWGPLLRCCAAFGIGTIFVVGYDQCDVRGSHGASKHVQLRAFPTHDRALEALAQAGEFELVGLLSANNNNNEDPQRVKRETHVSQSFEIELDFVRTVSPADDANPTRGACSTKKSFPVQSLENIPKRVCLVVDKLKCGLPWSLAKRCRSFVHIPHNNLNTDGSMLTLEASVSIVFHEVLSAGWTGYTEQTNTTQTDYHGQKYHVEKIHKGGNPNDIQARNRKRKEREDKLQALRDEADEQQQQALFGFDNKNDGDY